MRHPVVFTVYGGKLFGKIHHSHVFVWEYCHHKWKILTKVSIEIKQIELFGFLQLAG